jgi:hypothetical protein
MQLQFTPAFTLAVLALASTATATVRQYNTFQISGGVGGGALAQAEAAFPGALDSLDASEFQDVNVSIRDTPSCALRSLTMKVY